MEAVLSELLAGEKQAKQAVKNRDKYQRKVSQPHLWLADGGVRMGAYSKCLQVFLSIVIACVLHRWLECGMALSFSKGLRLNRFLLVAHGMPLM